VGCSVAFSARESELWRGPGAAMGPVLTPSTTCCRNDGVPHITGLVSPIDMCAVPLQFIWIDYGSSGGSSGFMVLGTTRRAKKPVAEFSGVCME
jgi:hypothetical protein